jgi:LPPG:FO 2-phospho-L-lactate transferase
MTEKSQQVIALCGGVGGAKLALGQYRILGTDRLTLVVNIGDDFEHLGLSVSPDVDTVLYILASLADRERGWSRAGDRLASERSPVPAWVELQ